MSRLHEALQRASHSGETQASAASSNPVSPGGEDALTQFVAGGEEDAAVVADVVEEPGNPRWTVVDEPVPLPSESGGHALVVRPVRNLPAAVPRQDSSEDIQIRDVLQMLARQWMLMAGIVAVSLFLAAIYNALATPIYEARARLIIDPDVRQVVPFRQDAEDTSRVDYYLTQLEVLRSRGLAQKTLERLHLLSDNTPNQSAQIGLGEFMRSMSANPQQTPMGESRVINLAVRSQNPELAARLANGHAETYIDQNLETRRQGAKEATQWLNERLEELRKQVNSRQGALQEYRQAKDAVSLEDRQNIVVQKLAQLNTAVTTARTERIDRESLYQQLVAIQQSGAPLDTFPPITSNAYIQGLKAELATHQREKAQLSENLGELHPDMIKVNTAIEGAERRLNQEIAKVVEGIKNDYKNAQAKERGFLGALESQKQEVLDLNQKSIGYGALQRDATGTQQVFEAVLQKVKETELSGQLTVNNARILDTAVVPQYPILPRKQLNLIGAFLLGAFLAVIIVVGLEYLNPRITDSNDVEERLGLPLLGVAPQVAELKKGPLTADRLPPQFQEALRTIRTRILLSPMAARMRTLAVTSSAPGEGKTVLASNLAISMVAGGRRVLLIDADMRRPQLHRVFDLPLGPGLSNILANEVKAPQAVRESNVKGLFVLPAGANVADASEKLDNEALSNLIEGFSKRYDLIILDCPPVMAVADTSIIANAAVSVLFVVRAGSTRKEVARAAIERLRSVQAHVVGVVLNKAKVSRRSEYYYLYHQQAPRVQ
jgi:succinoglycan biosynthesis transport protein ExoP